MFKFGTTKLSAPANSAPQADNREDPIKKKVKKKRGELRATMRQDNWKGGRGKTRREILSKRWKDEARIKDDEPVTAIHSVRKHILVAKGRRREARKSRLKRVWIWTNSANKMKRRKRPWSTKQDQ